MFPRMENLGWEIGYPSGNNQQLVRSMEQILCEKLEFKTFGESHYILMKVFILKMDGYRFKNTALS